MPRKNRPVQRAKKGADTIKASEGFRDLAREPVSNMYWIHRDQIALNDYNPNAVAPPELELLVISILEDGYTQPIVIRLAEPADETDRLFVVVDGAHRWLTSDDARLRARYNGLLPTVELQADPAHRLLSTIRHNRARGTHAILPMAAIVEKALQTMTPDELARRLQMEPEEVERLSNRAGMPALEGAGEFGQSWVPR